MIHGMFWIIEISCSRFDGKRARWRKDLLPIYLIENYDFLVIAFFFYIELKPECVIEQTVYIKLSAHGVFLEWSLSGMLKV